MSRYLIDQLALRSNIHTSCRTEVVAAHGDNALEAIDVRDSATGETSRKASGGLFIFIGADAETGWLPPEIALDHDGFVLTGSDMQATERWTLDRDPYLLETSVPGIFACGDVRSGPVKRVAASVGEGSMSIAFVHHYLDSLKVGKTVGRATARRLDGSQSQRLGGAARKRGGRSHRGGPAAPGPITAR